MEITAPFYPRHNLQTQEQNVVLAHGSNAQAEAVHRSFRVADRWESTAGAETASSQCFATCYPLFSIQLSKCRNNGRRKEISQPGRTFCVAAPEGGRTPHRKIRSIFCPIQDGPVHFMSELRHFYEIAHECRMRPTLICRYYQLRRKLPFSKGEGAPSGPGCIGIQLVDNPERSRGVFFQCNSADYGPRQSNGHSLDRWQAAYSWRPN